MAATINCPLTGSFTHNGTANTSLVTMHTVSLTEPDKSFTIPGDAFSYFDVSENGLETPTAASFVVSINNLPGLRTALGTWLTTATGIGGGGSVYNYMKNYLQTSVQAVLDGDGIGAELQSQVLSEIVYPEAGAGGFTAAAQTGAVNLINAVEDSQEAKDLIGLQFPYGRYGTGANGNGEGFSTALPAIAGDKLVFQFVITSTINVTEHRVDGVTAMSNAADVDPLEPPTNQINLSAQRSQRVNIEVVKGE
jgi:hypothetical protein